MTPKILFPKSDAVVRLACGVAIALSLRAQTVSISSDPTLYVTAGTNVTFQAPGAANWGLTGNGFPSGPGTLTPLANTVTSVYTAPAAVGAGQASSVAAAAGGTPYGTALVSLLAPSPSVSPVNTTLSTGQAIVFTVSGSQGDNWNSAEYLVLDISPTINYQWDNTCNVQYEPYWQGGTVYLADDNGGTFQHGTKGTSQVLSNSHCSVNLAGVTAVWNGVNVTVNLPITFASTYTGSKTVFAQPWPDTDQIYFTLGGITLLAGSNPSISVTPSAATLTPGQIQQFAATAQNLSSGAVNWVITPQVGTISSSGLYTAPSPVTTPQSVTVTATSQVNPSVSGYAAIALQTGIATDLNIPATTLTTGSSSYQATHSITATSGFIISGTASAAFTAGNQIVHGLGFHAGAGTTFIGTLGSVSGVPQTITTSPVTGLELTVAGAPPCTSPCSVLWSPGQPYQISIGSPVLIGATQYAFLNWSDGGAETHTVTAPSASTTYTTNLTTQYQLQTAALPATGGTVTPNTDGWYTASSRVPITATPSPGYVFTGFSGGLSGTLNPQTLVMEGPMVGAMAVTANFAATPPTYPLTTSVYPAGEGTITPASGGSYAAGASVPISAMANSGYRFIGFSGAITSTTSPGSVTMNGPESVTANFTAMSPLTITTTSLPAGQQQSAYSQTLVVTGGVPPYTWSLRNGLLPMGLALSGATLSGTPAAVGTYSFTIQVADSASNFAGQTFTVGITPAGGDFTLSALPSPQTIGPGGNAAYIIQVNASGVFSGSISLSIGILPAGVGSNFSASLVQSGQSTVLTLTASGSVAPNTFNIPVYGASNGLARMTMVTLTVAVPLPANIVSPGSGSILSSGTAAFTWNSGLGVSQYQLTLGSTPGASDYFSATLGTGASAYCPDGTLTCHSATATIPFANQPQTIYATLSSLISGVWKTAQYSYRIGYPALTGAPITLAFSAPGQSQPDPDSVINNNQSRNLVFQLLVGGSPEDAGYITGCSVSGSNVSAEAITVPSQEFPFDYTTFDVAITAGYAAAPGSRTLTCTLPPPLGSPSTSITVYDATPQIDYVYQYPPDYAGGPFYISVYGTNFGPPGGTLAVCNPAAAPECSSGTPDIQVSPGAPYATWTDHQINTLIVPSPTAAGTYLVQVRTNGETGLGFAAAPQSGTSSGSNVGQVTVNGVTPSVSITRQSLLQFTATGSPSGGTFSYSSSGACAYAATCPAPPVSPTVGFATGNTGQDNPTSGILSNPDNPCPGGVPCQGSLGYISTNYEVDPTAYTSFTGSAAFNVATFGMSCYYTTTQQEWGTAPESCASVTIYGITYSGYTTNPPGTLPAGNYCNSFLGEIYPLQGSGALLDGTLVQYKNGYQKVTQVRTALRFGPGKRSLVIATSSPSAEYS